MKEEVNEIVKHGVWSGDWDYICSICHESFEYKTNYCPHCGAKMENGEDE